MILGYGLRFPYSFFSGSDFFQNLWLSVSYRTRLGGVFFFFFLGGGKCGEGGAKTLTAVRDLGLRVV